MSFWRNGLIRLANAFVAILQSQFSNVKGHQFLTRLSSSSFFGISLIIPRLCDIGRYLRRKSKKVDKTVEELETSVTFNGEDIADLKRDVKAAQLENENLKK